MTIEKEMQSVPTLLSIKDFAAKHPFMSENSIRWMLFKNPPGLEECLVRVSSRIYLIEDKWIEFLLNGKLNKKKEGKDDEQR